MISLIHSIAHLGLDSSLIEVEADFTPAIPSMKVVGLGDKAVQESRERIQSGITQSGYEFPLGRITVNLAPADVVKNGAGFDLPIALAILHTTGIVKQLPKKAIFTGELSLSGTVRGVSSTISTCLFAKKLGFKSVFIPSSNAQEASLIEGITIFPVDNLRQVVDHLNQTILIEPCQYKPIESPIHSPTVIQPNDMAHIQGQPLVKRALEISAAGGHNILLLGNPGSGKTMLARAFPSILPPMTTKEIIEVTQLYSVVGLGSRPILNRPFRSPHHTASHIALVGGGSNLRPGEVSLAHRGVLFLDEFPEFSRTVIETLRQPLEDGTISINRASGSVKYPAKFILLAAANPTPSGFEENKNPRYITAHSRATTAYRAKFSGPIMDRIDLHVTVDTPPKEALLSSKLSESSAKIKIRVQSARSLQLQRFKGKNIFTNCEMNNQLIDAYCHIDSSTKNFFSQAIDSFHLSGRSCKRILKIARTIADLEGAENISKIHLSEALQYRPKMG